MNWLIFYTGNKLDKAYDHAASMLSYYNAAEGEQWYKEARGRGIAYAKLAVVKAEYTRRKRRIPTGSYLV